MIPPTPTPLGPIPTAPVQINDITLWDYAPNTVGLWNQMGDITYGFQIMVVIALIVMAYFFLSHLLRQVFEKRDDK